MVSNRREVISPAESVRKWMVFLSAQDESCQHPAQKIITAWRKAYSQSYESCQVFGSISVQMLFQTFAALRIRLLAAARIRLYSSLPFIAWPSVESQNRSRNMPACELATACRTRERSSLQGNGPDGQVNRVQQTFSAGTKNPLCVPERIL